MIIEIYPTMGNHQPKEESLLVQMLLGAGQQVGFFFAGAGTLFAGNWLTKGGGRTQLTDSLS